MLISSLEKMEQVVSRNNQLSWDGWTVLHTVPSPTGWKSPAGVFIKGKWYLQKRFELSTNGWEIPNKLVR